MMWIALGAGAVMIVVLGGALNTWRGYSGQLVPRETPAALSAKLSPGYRITRPDAPGPHPALLLFSGCDGPRDNMEAWATMAREEGWATIIIDSHGPRGFRDLQVWRLICAGQLLTGPERAGDVAVAMADVRALDFVDADRIALLGASHGGWAILDMLALHGLGERPYNLTEWPAGGIAGLAGVILLYPYCGVLSRVRTDGWQAEVPVRMLLARNDTVVNEVACERLAERMDAAGRDVGVTVFHGVTHGFEQEDKNALSNLEFDADSRVRALEMGRGFLADFARR